MSSEFQPAIDGLLKILADQEKKVVETKNTVNQLCEYSGRPKMFPDTAAPGQVSIGTIKGDTFYGKTIIVAAREYLEMRKVSNLGPASTRDIYEALKSGGFMFNSKSEGNSIVVVRNALSKASSIFHRLPTGDYGLAKWYDMSKIKRAKGGADDNADDVEIETSDPSEEESDVA